MTTTAGCEASSVAPRTTCPVCGFNGDQLSPADAAVAVRSYPRRYRVLLAGVGEDDVDDVLRVRSTASGASALDLTDHVATAFAQAAAHVRVVTSTPDAELDLPAPIAGVEAESRSDVLDRLEVGATALAGIADTTKGDAWLRAGTRGGAPMTAHDLVRVAVHEAAHHLRDVEDAVASALANRPDPRR